VRGKLNHRLIARIPSVFAALRRDVPGWLDMVGTMRDVRYNESAIRARSYLWEIRQLSSCISITSRPFDMRVRTNLVTAISASVTLTCVLLANLLMMACTVCLPSQHS